MRDRALRLAYRVGHRVLRIWWRVAHPRKHGVKMVIVRADEVLLVRHTYGRRRAWELPGGGVKRRESPLAAARRETHEELGLALEDWTFLGDLFARIDHRRDTLSCFRAEVGEVTLRLERAEIAEARWFRHDELPSERGRYVERIVALARARA